MKIWITAGVIVTLNGALLPAAGLAAVSIEQEDYHFKMDITRNVRAGTFVIGEYKKPPPLRPPAVKQNTARSRKPLTIRTRQASSPAGSPADPIPPVYFDLASAELPRKTATNLLAILEKKVRPSTPLKVTGFTCDLGTQDFNDTLAVRRAEAVADFLNSHGYVVRVVNGKGKQGYLSTNPVLRHLNRRVEIVPLKPTSERSGK